MVKLLLSISFFLLWRLLAGFSYRGCLTMARLAGGRRTTPGHRWAQPHPNQLGRQMQEVAKVTPLTQRSLRAAGNHNLKDGMVPVVVLHFSLVVSACTCCVLVSERNVAGIFEKVHFKQTEYFSFFAAVKFEQLLKRHQKGIVKGRHMHSVG